MHPLCWSAAKALHPLTQAMPLRALSQGGPLASSEMALQHAAVMMAADWQLKMCKFLNVEHYLTL